MQKPEALRVENQATLGSGEFGVAYLTARPPPVDLPRDPRAPLPAPEILVRLDAIVAAIHLTAPRPDTILRESLERVACAQHDTAAILTDLHTELQNLRADLAARTLAARTRRALAWLKGLFVWPSPD